MATVTFTKNIQRHLACPTVTVNGTTVREALDEVFEQNAGARSYVLDDQGALRKHMIIFVNGQQVDDRVGLSDAVPADAEIHVMQALSGG